MGILVLLLISSTVIGSNLTVITISKQHIKNMTLMHINAMLRSQMFVGGVSALCCNL